MLGWLCQTLEFQFLGSLSSNHDQLFDLLIVITTCSTGTTFQTLQTFWRACCVLGSLSVCTLQSTVPHQQSVVCRLVGAALLLWSWLSVCCSGLVYHVAATSAPQNGHNNNSNSNNNWVTVFGVFGASLLCSIRTDISWHSWMSVCLSV